MADPYGLELSGLDPETTAELRRLKRQELMADELAKRGMQPLQGQMVGGVYVRPSIFQGLSGLAQSWLAKDERDKIDEGYKALGEKRKAVEDAAFEKFQKGYFGSPEKVEQLPEGTFGPPQITPAVVPDANSKQQAIIDLIRSQSPTAKTIAPLMQSDLLRVREQQEFRDAIKGGMGGGQLTGFEPIKGGVPGQQGMVGDPQKLIQDIAMNPDMSNEDKQAAIAQIREQAAGAGGGQISPRTLLLSGNEKVSKIGQFLQTQEDKTSLEKQKAADKVALEKEKALERSRLSKEHDERQAMARLQLESTKMENRGLPTQALKMQVEEQDAIGAGGSIGADVNALIGQIDSGKLNLSLFGNWIAKGKNIAGISDEQSRNFNTLERTLEKIRNDSLRLNKGVQTEGDAQRAWNELVGSLSDPALVRQRLGEIKTINERAIDLRKQNINAIRSNYKLPPMDTGRMEEQKPVPGSGTIKTIATDAEYDALPSGTEYVGPDGKRRRKK